MKIKIGNKFVGDECPCYIVAEIGINHNGQLKIAKKLIDVAVSAGVDAVKFQKRTPELAVPQNQYGVLRETPWGTMTYIEYKRKIEFGYEEYKEIDKYCKRNEITWFASAWDERSVDFLEEFDIPVHKIPSAALTDHSLLKKIRETGKPIILSTGMSTMKQVKAAVDVLGGTNNLVIMHTVSTYPAEPEELNLRAINKLKETFNCPVGYSGHEKSLHTTYAAVALGADVVERHITLDRKMWGSDHAASIEPSNLTELVKSIRDIESALGDGNKRILPREIPIMKKLRRKDDTSLIKNIRSEEIG